jgi:hypothetical protein
MSEVFQHFDFNFLGRLASNPVEREVQTSKYSSQTHNT